MHDKKTDEAHGHLPIEPPADEDEEMEEPEEDLPGPGDDGRGVPPGTKERLRTKVAEERRRRERAELALPPDETE